MRYVPAFEAKAHFSALIDDAARGESIVITRRGVPVAQLGPVAESHADAESALSFLLSQKIRLGVPIRKAIDEGRETVRTLGTRRLGKAISVARRSRLVVNPLHDRKE